MQEVTWLWSIHLELQKKTHSSTSLATHTNYGYTKEKTAHALAKLEQSPYSSGETISGSRPM